MRRRVRAMIHHLKSGRDLHKGESVNHLTGLIAFIHMTDPERGRKFLAEIGVVSAEFSAH